MSENRARRMRQLAHALGAWVALAGMAALGGWLAALHASAELAIFGALVGVIVILAITRSLGRLDRDRRAAETRMREVNAWLNAVVDQMPVGVVLLDARGRVAAMNRAAQSLKCCEDDGRHDELGNPILFDVRTPGGEPVPVPELPLFRALVHGETTSGAEFSLRVTDGRRVPVTASAAPIAGGGGERAGAVVVFRDISERKELERLREEWASVVAHDLRQPVTVIKLAAGTLARLRGDELLATERQLFDRIRAAVAQADRMVGDLSDASRIEARRLQLEREAVDLRQLALEVVERHTDLVRVRVRARGDEAAVWADPGRIEQVLDNLLSNAAKYGEPDTEITVDVDGLGDAPRVTVTSRGRPIPRDELPGLFQRFARSDGRRAGVAGSGLGLYIARGIVEAHGGRIWAESDRTTRFCFTLPRYEVNRKWITSPSATT